MKLLSGILAFLIAGASYANTIELQDPKGDDKGPGTYTYPTDTAYSRGSFDLTKATLQEKGDSVEVRVTVGSRIKDPWRSKTWDGNGFSVQMFFIFIDTDHKPGSGYTEGLPGLNVGFDNATKLLCLCFQGCFSEN